MKQILHAAALAGLILLIAGPVPTTAQTPDTAITLINGMVITGKVVAVSEAGLEMQAGQAKRTYPWHALAPGTRFRYDMSYRTNLEGYLAGREPRERTTPPDPLYDPLHPDAAPPETDTQPTPASDKLNDLLYRPTGPMTPSTLRALRDQPASNFWFWARQYGAQSNDVVLFGFIPDSPPRLGVLDLRDGRWSAEKSRPQDLAGNSWSVFPERRFSSALGDIDLAITMQWRVAAQDLQQRVFTADVTASRGAESMVFSLYGIPDSMRPGNQMVFPAPLLQSPAIDFIPYISEEIPYLLGRIRMGSLSVLPGEGMNRLVKVEIKDAKGSVVLTRNVDHQAPTPDGYTLRINIEALTAGDRYALTASTGPETFLDAIEHRQEFIVPDALKP